MVKYRKSNLAKRVARGCGNNQGCDYCTSNRLHSINRTTAILEEQRAWEEGGPKDPEREENQWKSRNQ